MWRRPRSSHPGWSAARLAGAGLPILLAAAAPQPPGPKAPREASPTELRARRTQQTAQEQAQLAAAEEQQLAAGRVAAAARLNAVEAELQARMDEVAALTLRRNEAAARLQARAAAVTPLLPLVQRLALFPAETLLAVPAAPEQTVRGLAVLRGLARQLEAEATALRHDAAELEARSEALQASLPGLRAAQATQAAQAQELDAQIASAQATRRRAEVAGAEASRRAATEAARAESLRAALATLEAERARAEAQAREDAARADRQRQAAAAEEARRREQAMAHPSSSPPEPRGLLVQPVAGRVTRGWGDTTDAGPSLGISYRAVPGARVVAPCAGRIRFAGPFRSYGSLVILDCGGGYAFVLSGFGRLDVAAGGAVLAGEPVGVMPDGAGASPALYLELRREGQAVDPAPFLRRRP